VKVGDLIKEIDFPDLGVIIEIAAADLDAIVPRQYRVLQPNGNCTWFVGDYVEGACEVVSEGRV
jgi:hypothetical protein|tara:strand:+ start:1163 stop:1354 length:192 start_codon:yes stop_codon:yes gene_type:complete